MAQVSKNARAGSLAHKHLCPCGGEVKVRAVFSKGKKRNLAVCLACDRREGKPKDFK